MNKFLLLLLFYLISFPIISQHKKQSKYFPQEQILLKSCSDKLDPSTCVTYYFQDLVFSKLSDKKSLKQISKLKKDTLCVDARLVFSPNQMLDKEKSYSSVCSKKIGNKLKKSIDSIFLKVDVEKVINQKMPLISYHNFKFKYLILRNGKEISLKLNASDQPYSGGDILEIPVFPGCEDLNDNDAKNCFNSKMQAHIGKHFNYPKEAQRKRLQGKVSILFVIDKEGDIDNIRTKSHHEILDQEAVRIVKLLPKMQPGLLNGEPARTPYSIPITFKLD